MLLRPVISVLTLAGSTIALAFPIALAVPIAIAIPITFPTATANASVNANSNGATNARSKRPAAPAPALALASHEDCDAKFRREQSAAQESAAEINAQIERFENLGPCGLEKDEYRVRFVLADGRSCYFHTLVQKIGANGKPIPVCPN